LAKATRLQLSGILAIKHYQQVVMVTVSAVNVFSSRRLSAFVTLYVLMWLLSAWCCCDTADIIRLGEIICFYTTIT